MPPEGLSLKTVKKNFEYRITFWLNCQQDKGEKIKTQIFKAVFSHFYHGLLIYYSLRKASIGSIRAALRAGSKPKVMPQSREKAMATIKE